MTPTTRRAILNLALCCHNCRDPSPQRIARLARMVSCHYHRDSTLTTRQSFITVNAFQNLVVAIDKPSPAQRRIILRLIAAQLNKAASYPDEPTRAVVYGIT